MAVFSAIATAVATFVASAAVPMGAAWATFSAVFYAAYGVTYLALGLGMSMLTSALMPKPKFQNPSSQYQAVINQPAAPRRRGYGRAKLGGVRAFFDSTGGSLYQIVMLHSGRVDAIEKMYLGDAEVTTNSAGLVEQWPFGIKGKQTATVTFETMEDMNADLDHPAGTIAAVSGEFYVSSDRYVKIGASGSGSWEVAPLIVISSHVIMASQLGTTGQTAEPIMTAAWSGVWTSAHRLRGVAYIAARFISPESKNYMTVFPEGHNTPIRAVCRLSRILDTRTSTTAWSDNPALILADYLTHPDGYRRLTYDDIDTASFNAFADLCDELVPLAAGGSEKRYRAWGMYEMNDDPKNVVQRILDSCDGELFTTADGKLGLRGGKWSEPTVTIEDADVLGHDLEEGADALDRFNQLKIVYTSPDHDYQPTETTPWDDLADQAVRGIQSQDFSVDMCPSPSQARRLAKIMIAKSNPRWKGTIRTNLVGLRARGERIINLVLPELGIDGSFLVASHNLMMDNGIPIGCELAVLSLDSSAYAWTTAEEGTNPAIPQDTRPDGTLPVPTGLLPVVERRQLTSATVASLVIATVNPPDRSDLRLEAEIRLSSSLAWEAMSVADESYEAVSNIVADGLTYFVRARFATAGGAGDWSDEEDIVIIANPTAPDAPTNFSLTGSGPVSLSWTNPTDNFTRWRVFRSDTSSFGGATAIATLPGLAGQESDHTDNPGTGTWYYWVVALNESNVASAPAGPEDVTI